MSSGLSEGPRKVGQVEESVLALNKSVANLVDMFKQIQSKLASVAKPPAAKIECEKQERKGAEYTVPLACAITGQALIIQELHNEMAELIQRLEL